MQHYIENMQLFPLQRKVHRNGYFMITEVFLNKYYLLLNNETYILKVSNTLYTVFKLC